MSHDRINFYAEVIICKNYPGIQKDSKGVVLGISEEDGVLYGYSILLHGEELTMYFDKKYVTPTGKTYSRSDFY